MFTPARNRHRNLSWNCKLKKYTCAFDMNSSVPVTMAQMKAPQVYGSTSCDNFDTALSREATPTRRRSTMTMEPNTIASEITCSVSTIGKSHSPPSSPRIAVASEVCSTTEMKLARLIRSVRAESEVEFPGVADEAAAEDDSDPQAQGGQREPFCPRRTGGRRIPLRRITSHRPSEPDYEGKKGE